MCKAFLPLTPLPAIAILGLPPYFNGLMFNKTDLKSHGDSVMVLYTLIAILFITQTKIRYNLIPSFAPPLQSPPPPPPGFH